MSYFIDRYNVETGDHEEVDHWKHLNIEDVHLVIEHHEFEEGFIYCLSETHGEEDIARWTFDNQTLINSYLEYLTEKDIFSNIHD